MATRLCTLVLWVSLVPAGACSGDEGGDGGGSDPDRGGTGSSSGGTTAGGNASGGGGSGGQAPAVDCSAVCERVRTNCTGQSTIDDFWVDVCTSQCDARLQLTPDVAVMEKNCVEAATTCSASILCVTMPSGSGGSGGSS